MTEPLEIERKFLIEMPERAVLDRCPTRWEIWQTYLLAPPGISARVRRRVGETEQFFPHGEAAPDRPHLRGAGAGDHPGGI